MSRAMAELCSLRSRRMLNTSPQELSMLVTSVEGDRVNVFKTAGGEPIGYMAWMSLTPESVRYVKDYRALPPYSYEWSEGRLMMIFDVVVAPGWSKVVFDQMAQMLSGQKVVSYFKRGRLKFLDKKLLRKYLATKAIC